MKTLLIIDLQTAMFDGRLMPPIHKAGMLIDNARSVLHRARDQGVPVVFVQHDDDPGGPLAPHTPGWTLHAAIAPLSHEPVVRKSRSDAFHKTDLTAHLDRLRTRQLIILGAQTEFCIDTNCRAAAARDYDVTLLGDTHSTWDNDILTADQIIAHHNTVLKGGFVTLATAAQYRF